MQQGVDCIHKGVLLATYSRIHLLSRPDLLVKQPGQSCFGDWDYVLRLSWASVPSWNIKLAAFHAQVLATTGHSRIQPGYCCVEKAYAVNLGKLVPQMQRILEYQTNLRKRLRCSLPVSDAVFAVVLSVLCDRQIPATPLSFTGCNASRYTQLQELNLVTVESLANASS